MVIHTTQEYRIGDAVELMQKLPIESVDLVFTSPPYWQQRNYRVDGQLGLESTIEEYVDNLLRATSVIKRVLKPSGVFCLNIGDTYYGGGHGATPAFDNGEVDFKDPKFGEGCNDCPVADWDYSKYQSKCMCGIPERVMLGCIDQGWILRDKTIWAKKVWFAKTNKTVGNGMPSSVRDRNCSCFEPVYMFTKSPKYWTDMDAIRVPYTEPLDRWGGERLHPLNANSKWDEGTGQDTYRERDMRPNMMGATSPNVWQINTKPYTSGFDDVEHFAAFPPALAERIITAFCPDKICPVCGHIGERIVERDGDSSADYMKDKDKSHFKSEQHQKQNMGAPVEYYYRSSKTVGWTSCDCGANLIAGMVLDPFAGSGTVGEVARELNRNAILFDLNPDYGRLISERIMEHTPPLTSYYKEDE